MPEVAQQPRGSRLPSPDRTAGVFLRVAGRLYGRVEGALRPTGLSYAHYRVLERLGGAVEHDPGLDTLSPGGGSRVHGLILELERAGLVRRFPVGDHELVGAELTPLGVARLEAASKRLQGVVSDFAQALDRVETLGFHHLLGKALAARRPSA